MAIINRLFWVGMAALMALILMIALSGQINVYALVDNDNGPAFWQLVWGKHLGHK